MKNPLKVFLGIFIGIVVAAGVTYYVLDRKYDKELASVRSEYAENIINLEHERDSVQFHADSIQLVLDDYAAIVDSFTVLDETQQSQIESLEMELLEALAAVYEALPDVNYDFLQTRYITSDTLQYAFSGEQVNGIATDVVKGDYNDSLVVRYKDVERLLRDQAAVRDEIIITLSEDRHDLATLAQELYDRIEVIEKSSALKDEEIVELKKAKRMWRNGALGAGAFVVLVLLLL